MSHARVIIAIPEDRANDINAAVEWEMMPFDEDGKWFRDGSRWDWYVIGGRFTGAFSNYDPEKDPANMEVCTTCNGSGKRPNALEEFGQAWIDATHGCNGCNGEGKRVKWPTQWTAHSSDTIQVKNLNLTAMLEKRKHDLIEDYNRAAKGTKQGRELIYGVDPDEISLDAWLAENLDGVAFPASSAFLINRHWHEAERMGWFGSTAATECELKARGNGATVEEMIRRCKYKDEATGACVVVWNEPYEIWQKEFYSRFIEKLDPGYFLVNVDYHV